jgi:hypothetical protein
LDDRFDGAAAFVTEQHPETSPIAPDRFLRDAPIDLKKRLRYPSATLKSESSRADKQIREVAVDLNSRCKADDDL